ncbi:NYN domain-containing protein [Patescibacteria group bacterium]
MKKRTRKVMVLVDYDNINISASEEGKIIDLKAIIEKCLEFGTIEFAFLFASQRNFENSMGSRTDLPMDAHNNGFIPVVCPGTIVQDGELKQKDKVDSIMINLARKYLQTSLIDSVVIVSHDEDFLPLANDFRFKRKQVIVMAGEKSYFLKQAVDFHVVLPMKNKI